ncbi:MAG: hypothetical protein ISR96_13465 [Nitrospira sp.]|nr:hypothetical protein [Nitrospira sp.]
MADNYIYDTSDMSDRPFLLHHHVNRFNNHHSTNNEHVDTDNSQEESVDHFKHMVSKDTNLLFLKKSAGSS